MTAPLAETIRAHVDALCALGPDRHPGTEANRLAAQYVAEHLERAGATVERLGFETVGWRREGAALAVGETSVAAHPGPYSPPVEATAELAAASTLEGLKAIEKPGCVLLLHGPLASEQLTPRDYPWYGNAEHAAILDAIEAARPVAVIAATGKSPGTTAALSPFPLIEDTGFPIPSAYVSEADGERLLARVGGGRPCRSGPSGSRRPASSPWAA